MSSRVAGFWINLFVVGWVLMALGAAVSYLIPQVNQLTALGMTSQNGVNTFNMLTILFYVFGFVFLLASGINIVVNARRKVNNQEV